MRRSSIYCLSVLTLIAAIAVGFAWNAESAGKPVKRVDGTPGNLAKWVTATELGDSVIAEDATGHVAIGSPPGNMARFWVDGTLDGTGSAIRGQNTGTGRGVSGISHNGMGVNGVGLVGVNARTTSNIATDAALRASSSGRALAGQFFGNVTVSGFLTKGGGAFRIDHPLDPKNKYLSHSFVESPDMMNIYNGNITTGDQGEAIVEMPAYFDALNRDFRYQLTVIGQFAQAMVLEKIKGNRFKIKTDKPRVDVSWQVTGVRKDKFAEDNRIKVESDKPESERGKLQNP